MEQVEKDQALWAEAQAATWVDEKKASAQSAEATGIKESVQKDLDEWLPEYYNAIKALDSLNKNDITEVKGFTKPPELVQTVLEAVCLLLGRKQTWDEAKKVMSDTGFLNTLKNYDKDWLSKNAKLTKQLKKFMEIENFKPDLV